MSDIKCSYLKGDGYCSLYNEWCDELFCEERLSDGTSKEEEHDD